jgi:hypothetical protein
MRQFKSRATANCVNRGELALGNGPGNRHLPNGRRHANATAARPSSRAQRGTFSADIEPRAVEVVNTVIGIQASFARVRSTW